FDEGWGFCGTEDYQSKCNEIAEQVMDTRLMGIHRLNNEYCVEQLKINLAKEMPEVEEREFNDLDKVGTICVGKNVTLKMKNFEVFEVNKSLTKFTKIKLDETRRKNVEAGN
ncbi:uncharacterized protein LOC111715602, partial [Eurytemora carolleeae]|uniref:uncharacterized protein LOC111715602 n=1 Tax=Eurytemora carolleeae TaxID=1294199 RepID=UPI000C795473